ncbi:MAG: glycosyltransferase family 2 protein [Planctomycetales bacterium]|nr:glycosyltransferase family 2 protein [Planctomycetales bacterium]
MSDAVSIVIPTLGRDTVLTDTIDSLLQLPTRAAEILVVDQTPQHAAETTQQLAQWNAEGAIRWIRLDRPSITRSMNHGLRESKSKLVLFLDDDIRPRGDIIAAHRRVHESTPGLWATVGQVIQPWQHPAPLDAPRKLTGLRVDEDFPFHSTLDMDVQNVMAGNLCVRRDCAISIEGFDENFQGSAYRFETEFAKRVIGAGGRIRFVADAGIDHLRVASGGTRTRGNHMTSASPHHGVGDHYYALLHSTTTAEAYAYCFRRMFREVRTKFHLTHPWWIPVKLVGEARALLAARRLVADRSKHDAQSGLSNLMEQIE